jgi:hypothetical protein
MTTIFRFALREARFATFFIYCMHTNLGTECLVDLILERSSDERCAFRIKQIRLINLLRPSANT